MGDSSSGAQLTARELALVALAGSLLALVDALAAAAAPRPRHPAGPRRPARPGLAGRLGRPCAAHQPLALFQANMFWPLRDSLAFSDALVGYAPAGLIGSGVDARRSPATTSCSCSRTRCAFAGAYLLARELGAGRAGGVVAGAAFAYAPVAPRAGRATCT